MDQAASTPRPPESFEIAPTRPQSHWKAVVALSVCGIVYILMLVVGGELRQFALAGLESIPFAILAAAAYAAAGHSMFARFITIGYWTGLMAFAGLILISFTIVGFMESSPDSYLSGAGMPPRDHLISIAMALLGLLIAGAVGLLCFLPPMRQAAARILAIDAGSFVHATALATAIAIALMCLVPLLVLKEPPILIMLKMEDPEFSPTAEQQLRSTFYSLVWAVPVAFVAVGYPRRRRWRDAVERLSLVRPTGRQFVIAGVLTIILGFFMEALNSVVTSAWNFLGWPITDDVAVMALYSFALGPFGAIVVSLAAGLGEELAFRGVLQPRLGILLPALMFASVHALQYNFDALIQVLLMGILFGFVRKWSNTTTAAMIHMGYDFIALMQVPA